MKNKYTEIIWQDHWCGNSWWTKEEIAEEVKKVENCVTVGRVTYEDDEFIVLSATFDGKENYNGNQCIIKNHIIKRRTL